MKARAVSYGAVELKQLEQRYMAAGLTFSVAIHLCVIAVYILKGVTIYDGPPLLPPQPRPHNPGDGHVQVYTGGTDIVAPRLPRGGTKHVGHEHAIPIPVPLPPSREDSLLFKPGGSVLGGVPGVGDGAAEGGEGIDVGPVETEKEPEPYVPVEKNPVLIKKIDPAYPELALKAGLEGKVWVKIWVDREGRAHKAELLKSTAEIFNEAALAAAMRFVFVPAYMNGGPVPVWVSIPFAFKLK